MKNRKEQLQIIGILLVVFVMSLFGVHSLVKAFDTDTPKSENSISASSEDSKEQEKPEEDITAGTSSQQSTSETGENADDFSTFYNLDLSDAEEPKDLLDDEDFMKSLQQAGMSEEEIKAAINEMQDHYEKSSQ